MLTEQQKATRKGRVTSTSMAAILGVHPWMTPHDAWLAITGRYEKPVTKAMSLGTVLERYVADEYEAHHLPAGLGLARGVGTIVSPDHDWLAASPDGLVVADVVAATCHDLRDVRGGFEGKTSGWAAGTDFGLDWWVEQWERGIPPMYAAQADVMLVCTGAPWWDVCAAVPSLGLVVHRRERDGAHLANLIEIGRAWWERHIRDGVEPEVSRKDLPTLAQLYDADDEAEADLPEAVVREHAEARLNRIRWEHAEELAEAKLKVLMGPATAARVADSKITWKEQQGQRYIDGDELPDDLREKATKRRAPYRVFRVTGELYPKPSEVL